MIDTIVAPRGVMYLILGLAISTSVTQGAASATLDYYRFEDGPAGGPLTTVTDSATPSRNGSLLGGDPTYSAFVPSSRIPQTGARNLLSAQLGSGDSLAFNYPFPFQTLKDATLELFVQPTVLDQENVILWGNSTPNSGDANRFFLAIEASGYVNFNYRAPDGTAHYLMSSTETANIIPSGEWSYIGIEKISNTYVIAVLSSATNNKLKIVSRFTDVSPNLPTATGWTLNGRLAVQPADCCQFSGLVDEVRISDTALTSSQLLIHRSGIAVRP